MARFGIALFSSLVLFAGIARGQQPAPATETAQIQVDMTIVELSVPQDQEMSILKAFGAKKMKAAKSSQVGAGFWTTTNADSAMQFAGRLRDRDAAKILLCPKMITNSGQQVSFVSGGNAPLTDLTPDGIVHVKYVEVGARVIATPIITPSGTIQLQLTYISKQVNQSWAPAYSTHQMQLSAEVAQGETAVVLLPASRRANAQPNAPTHLLLIARLKVVSE